MISNQFDIAIVGGGAVGIITALMLKQLPNTRIALIDTPIKRSHLQHPLVLSHTTQQTLSSLNIWPKLAQQTTTIKNVHISIHNQPGITKLKAEEANLPTLGHTTSFQDFLNALKAIPLDGITTFIPMQATKLYHTENGPTLTLQNSDTNKEQSITSKLIIAADGTHSKIRQMLGIPNTEGQPFWALATHVKHSKPHQNWAYQRFTDHGTLALLPREQDTSGLIYCINDKQKQQFETTPKAELQKQLQQNFGHRLGTWQSIDTPYFIPIHPQHAHKTTQSKVILLGNAANTLHPNTGQGLNLALQDASHLTHILKKAYKDGIFTPEEKHFTEYQNQRKHKQRHTRWFTNQLAPILSSKFKPLKLLTNASLIALDNSPKLKSHFIQWILGHTYHHEH